MALRTECDQASLRGTEPLPARVIGSGRARLGGAQRHRAEPPGAAKPGRAPRAPGCLMRLRICGPLPRRVGSRLSGCCRMRKRPVMRDRPATFGGWSPRRRQPSRSRLPRHRPLQPDPRLPIGRVLRLRRYGAESLGLRPPPWAHGLHRTGSPLGSRPASRLVNRSAPAEELQPSRNPARRARRQAPHDDEGAWPLLGEHGRWHPGLDHVAVSS